MASRKVQSPAATSFNQLHFSVATRRNARVMPATFEDQIRIEGENLAMASRKRKRSKSQASSGNGSKSPAPKRHCRSSRLQTKRKAAEKKPAATRKATRSKKRKWIQ
jgi:hypothetical protein